jgi:hypothetical protein
MLSDFLLASAILLVTAVLVVPCLFGVFGQGMVAVRYVPRLAWRLGLALGLSLLTYVVGSVALGSGSPLQSVPALGAGLFALLVSFPVLAAVSPWAAARLASRPLRSLAGLVSMILESSSRWRLATASVALTRIPLGHIRGRSERDARDSAIRFQRFASVLAESGMRVEFRLSFRDGAGKASISATACVERSELEGSLLSLVRACLPETLQNTQESVILTVKDAYV